MLDRLRAVSSGSIKGRNLSRWVRAGLAGVLLVWLAWMLVDTIWLFLSGSPRIVSRDDSLPVLERTVATSGNASGSLSLDRVSAWELFGPVQEQVATVVEAPETRLRLELLGVFQHPSDELASAIIAEQGKNGELYHVGDRLPGNATLERVYPDRVILMRAGQRETLRMKEEAAFSASEFSRAPEQPESKVEAVPEAQDLSQAPEHYQKLMGMRQDVMEQLNLVLAEGGGYRVGSATPQARLVGLRENDVIVSINGYDLGTEEADLAAIASYEQTKKLSAVILRDDQMFTFTYPP